MGRQEGGRVEQKAVREIEGRREGAREEGKVGRRNRKEGETDREMRWREWGKDGK